MAAETVGRKREITIVAEDPEVIRELISDNPSCASGDTAADFSPMCVPVTVCVVNDQNVDIWLATAFAYRILATIVAQNNHPKFLLMPNVSRSPVRQVGWMGVNMALLRSLP